MSDFLQERFKVMINNYNKTQVDRDSIDTVQMQVGKLKFIKSACLNKACDPALISIFM